MIIIQEGTCLDYKFSRGGGGSKTIPSGLAPPENPLIKLMTKQSWLTPARDRLLCEREDLFPTSLAPPALSKSDCRMSTRPIKQSSCLYAVRMGEGEGRITRGPLIIEIPPGHFEPSTWVVSFIWGGLN